MTNTFYVVSFKKDKKFRWNSALHMFDSKLYTIYSSEEDAKKALTATAGGGIIEEILSFSKEDLFKLISESFTDGMIYGVRIGFGEQISNKEVFDFTDSYPEKCFTTFTKNYTK